MATAPLLGGYLITAASRRRIFFINLPIAGRGRRAGRTAHTESRDPTATGRLDEAEALAAVVFLLLTLTTHGSNCVVYVLPAVLVFGLGLGLAITVTPLTATAMNSAPAGQSGMGSAANNDVARFGGLLAVAVLSALSGITGTVYLHPETSWLVILTWISQWFAPPDSAERRLLTAGIKHQPGLLTVT